MLACQQQKAFVEILFLKQSFEKSVNLIKLIVTFEFKKRFNF